MKPSLLFVLLAVIPALAGSRVSPRIVGGSFAQPHAFPYSAFLVVHGSISWYCHGALISENMVLTTGSCLTYSPASYVDVKLGAQNITFLEDTQTVYRSTDFVLSPTPQRLAIVRLPLPVVPTDSISPIQVPPLSDIDNTFEGQTGTVAGWGLTDPANGNAISDVLKAFEGQIINNVECMAYFAQVPETYLCTLPAGVGSGCGGDDGAPLVVNGTTLVGLLGAYSQACDVNLPTAFVRVTADLAWIYQYLEMK